MYKKRKMQKQKCTVNFGFLELRASKWCFAFLQEKTVIEIEMDEVRLPPSCRKLSPPKRCVPYTLFSKLKGKGGNILSGVRQGLQCVDIR